MRAKGFGKYKMGLVCLLGGRAIKRLLHIVPAMGQFVAIRSPHLENAVGETKLKNSSRNCRICALITQVDLLPGLNTARLIFHH